MIFEVLYWAFPLALNAACLLFCLGLWRQKKRAGAVALALFALACMAYPIWMRPY